MSISELKYPKNRLRRTRQAKWIRNLTQESILSSNDLVWPVFVCEGNNIKDEIQSMPNVYRYSIDNLNEVYDIASEHKINLIAVFPFTPQELKTKYGDEALNPDNLVCRSLEKLKSHKCDFGITQDTLIISGIVYFGGVLQFTVMHYQTIY